jgi:hypothetical protein
MRFSARCKLTIVTQGVVLYDGDGRSTEKVTRISSTYTVVMRPAEPFVFTSADGMGWLIGRDDVEFRDLVKGGIFKRSDFALAGAE